MREEFGDIWEMAKRPNSVVCITTNGALNAKGECVMGRGAALQARKRYPGIAKELGDKIRQMGNHCHALQDGRLLSFPTKHVWWEPSNLELIRLSAIQLKVLASLTLPGYQPFTFYLPRPGCSNGGLRWEDVKPVLESVGLPDNVVAVDREKNHANASTNHNH